MYFGLFFRLHHNVSLSAIVFLKSNTFDSERSIQKVEMVYVSLARSQRSCKSARFTTAVYVRQSASTLYYYLIHHRRLPASVQHLMSHHSRV